MILTRKELNQIFKTNVDIETDISANDKISKILGKPLRYPKTTLHEKLNDYKIKVNKNPNSIRNKENLEYIEFLIKEKKIIPIITQEIETEIINRNRQKKEENNISGIYGYFDTKTGKYIYVGKDSNITLNLRDNQHYADDSQQINRILRNDKEGRYEYNIIETMKNATDLALDTAERYYIELFNTYHYENPEGMNFTKGGEKSYGIESEADINYDRVTRRINSQYKGQRDGIPMKKRDLGKNGDTFKLSTNGSAIVNGKKVPKFRIENESTRGGLTSNGDIRYVLNKFKKLNFKDSELKVAKRIRNEYEDILTEFGY